MIPRAPEDTPADKENESHRYAGSAIPWYVHLLWLSFWVFAIAYVIRFLFPAIQGELLSPP